MSCTAVVRQRSYNKGRGRRPQGLREDTAVSTTVVIVLEKSTEGLNARAVTLLHGMNSTTGVAVAAEYYNSCGVQDINGTKLLTVTTWCSSCGPSVVLSDYSRCRLPVIVATESLGTDDNKH